MRYLCVLFPRLEVPVLEKGRVDAEGLRFRQRQFSRLFPFLREQVLDLWSPACGIGVGEAGRLARFAGGDGKILAYLRKEWGESVGEPFNLGIADGVLAALLAADSNQIVEAGSRDEFLSGQPLASVLRLLPAELEAGPVLEKLAALGVTRIGQIRNWPAGKLESRFGSAGREIAKLVTGGVPGYRPVLKIESPVSSECIFDPPAAELERCLFALNPLSQDFLGKADASGKEVKRIRIRLSLENGQELEKEFTLPDFAVKADITRRCRWQLQNWFQPGNSAESAIEKIGLLAVQLVPAKGAGRPLWGRADTEGGAWQLVDRAGQILGENAVLGVSLQGGFDPRSRVDLHPFHSPPLRLISTEGSWEGQLAQTAPEIVFASPRPVKLRNGFRTVEINLRDSLVEIPKTLEWKGKIHQIEKWGGPWRVLDNWWKENAGVRRPRHYLKIYAPGVKLLLVTVDYGKTWWADAQWLGRDSEAASYGASIT